MIGTPTSAASIAANGGTYVSGTTGGSVLDMTTSGITDGYVMGSLIPGATPPTAPITVKIDVMTDGTNWTTVVNPSYVLGSSATNFDYEPPRAAQKVRVTVTNPDTAQAITAYVQGSTLAIS